MEEQEGQERGPGVNSRNFKEISALSLINRTILIAYFPHMQKKT